MSKSSDPAETLQAKDADSSARQSASLYVLEDDAELLHRQLFTPDVDGDEINPAAFTPRPAKNESDVSVDRARFRQTPEDAFNQFSCSAKTRAQIAGVGSVTVGEAAAQDLPVKARSSTESHCGIYFDGHKRDVWEEKGLELAIAATERGFWRTS